MYSKFLCCGELEKSHPLKTGVPADASHLCAP